MSNRVGCMACSGDVCAKCRFWRVVAGTKWGVCDYFTANPGAPRRIYSGNIKGLAAGDTVQTTDLAKCRNFVSRQAR